MYGLYQIASFPMTFVTFKSISCFANLLDTISCNCAALDRCRRPAMLAIANFRVFLLRNAMRSRLRSRRAWLRVAIVQVMILYSVIPTYFASSESRSHLQRHSIRLSFAEKVGWLRLIQNSRRARFNAWFYVSTLYRVGQKVSKCMVTHRTRWKNT